MLKNSRLFRVFLPLALVLLLAGISFAAMLRSPRKADYDSDSSRPSRRRQALLPNTGRIAVLADSTDSQHAAIAEAAIIDELVANGYTVIDDAELAKIHRRAEREKVISRAFGGNVSGIANIGRSHKAAYTILARVKAGIPERNEAKLYTGTASAVIMAVSSNGDKLGGKTASGKAVGYTIDEAREKAIEKAIREGLSQLF